MTLRVASLLLLVAVAGCGSPGAPQYGGAPPSAEATFGQCAFCHMDKAVNMLAAGSDLKCEVCHNDQTPGFVGPGHRSIPGSDRVPSFVGATHKPGVEGVFGSCSFCHNQFALNLTSVSQDLKCQTCHADQMPGIYGPGHRRLPTTAEVPSFVGPTHQTGAEGIFGSCAICHNQFAVSMTDVGQDLKCQNCHADQKPGMFGAGHRSIPGTDQVPSFVGPTHQTGAEGVFGSCAFCHNQFAQNLTLVSNELTCVVCHTNNLLPGVFGPGHRNIPTTDLVPAFIGVAHDTGALSVFGSCAFCHSDLATNVAASGADLQCVFCHQTALSPNFGAGHRSIPGPERVPSFVGPTHAPGADARFGSCAFCHSEVTMTAAMSSGHGSRSLDCAGCHTNQLPGEVGPGHESVPRCADCHTVQQTHNDPGAGSIAECTVCHTPHGSPNLFLINPQIVIPTGQLRPIQFTNLLGLADGSFAAVSHPGTGVCEVCHTQTRHYRNDGSGEPHFPYTCFVCHPHAAGFMPQ